MGSADRRGGRALGVRGVLVALALLAGGCQSLAGVPGLDAFTGSGPKATVGTVLAAIAAHDLPAARSWSCPDVAGNALPLPVNVLLPLNSLPDLDEDTAITTVAIDFSGLTATEDLSTADDATVHVRGPIGLVFDTAAVRELAVRSSGGDQELVDRVMAVTAASPFTVSTDFTVTLRRIDGRWLICPPPEGARRSG